MLKVKDLREKTIEELNEEYSNLKTELLESRLAFYSRQLENTAAMKMTKKSIAKVLTVIKEKELEEGATNA